MKIEISRKRGEAHEHAALITLIVLAIIAFAGLISTMIWAIGQWAGNVAAALTAAILGTVLITYGIAYAVHDDY